MKIYVRLIGFAVLSLMVFSCKEDDSSSQQVTIEEYIESKNVEGLLQTNSGLYYRVDKEGGDIFAEETDIMVSNVVLSSLNDDLIFEGLWHSSLDETSFLTDGMKEAFALIPVDGKITVFIPSELGYGAEGLPQVGIKANEDFKIVIEHQSIKMSIDQYIEENQIENVIKTQNGLYYVILEQGEGDFPTVDQEVSVHYTGEFFDGTIFDSSIGVSPFSFRLGVGTVIAGWDEGISLFKVGGKGILLVPHQLAYGASGVGAAIPPYEHLRFDIELVAIN